MSRFHPSYGDTGSVLDAQILNGSNGLSGSAIPTSLTGFKSRPRFKRLRDDRFPDDEVEIGSGASHIEGRSDEVEPNKS